MHRTYISKSDAAPLSKGNMWSLITLQWIRGAKFQDTLYTLIDMLEMAVMHSVLEVLEVPGAKSQDNSIFGV